MNQSSFLSQLGNICVPHSDILATRYLRSGVSPNFTYTITFYVRNIGWLTMGKETDERNAKAALSNYGQTLASTDPRYWEYPWK